MFTKEALRFNGKSIKYEFDKLKSRINKSNENIDTYPSLFSE